MLIQRVDHVVAVVVEPGDGLTLVVTNAADRSTTARLTDVVPGVQFASRD